MLDPSLRWPQFKLAVELTHVHANVKRYEPHDWILFYWALDLTLRFNK